MIHPTTWAKQKAPVEQLRTGERSAASQATARPWKQTSETLRHGITRYLSIHPCIYPSIHLSIYLSIYPSIHLVTLYIYVYEYVCPYLYMSIHRYRYLSCRQREPQAAALRVLPRHVSGRMGREPGARSKLRQVGQGLQMKAPKVCIYIYEYADTHTCI